MKRSYLDLITSAYRLDLDDDQWYADLAERAARVVGGGMAMCYAFDASDPKNGVRLGRWGASGVSQGFVEGTLQLQASTSESDAAVFYHQGVLCGTVSEMLERAGRPIAENDTYGTTVASRGFPDTFGLTASSPAWRGVVINSPLAEVTSINPRTRLAWRKAGVHLQSAFRLREALRGSPANPEAVVDPEKGVVHVEGDARTSEARERLRDAALMVDRLRSRAGPEDTADALELWQGLVDGRWSLIESFESDRRRLFLAYPNNIDLASSRALSTREREIVGYVVQGDSNKWIAYQLGVSAATVARHVSIAMQKLGVSHRHQLIWLYNSLQSGDRSS